MKEKWINQVKVEGYVFDHTLEERVAGENAKHPGQKFINGTLSVATDDEGVNVIPVSFTYVVPIFNNGNENRTYGVLKGLIDNCRMMKNLPNDEKTSATKVSIDAQIEVNDFLGRDGNMVAAQRVRGSFCNLPNTIEEPAANFKADMLIMAANEKEVEDGDDYLELRGFVFDFRGGLIPVTFCVRNKGGMKYFLDQDISTDDPCLTNVHGEIECRTIVRETREESAWGDDDIRVSTRTVRSWNILGSAKETMEFDDESTITWDELKEAKEVRDEYVAQQKKRAEESRSNSQTFSDDEKPAEKKKSKGFRF